MPERASGTHKLDGIQLQLFHIYIYIYIYICICIHHISVYMYVYMSVSFVLFGQVECVEITSFIDNHRKEYFDTFPHRRASNFKVFEAKWIQENYHALLRKI